MHKPNRHRHRHERPATIAARALLIVSFLTMWLGSALCAQPVPPAPATPLIAVGDIHGDFDDFVLILRRAGVVDAQRHWAGVASTLVQIGDMLDRGPKEREVLDLLMSLEPEARKAGGQVVVLLGNHEAMNILGDLRYVTAAEYASFADGDSEKRRSAAYRQYVAWYKNHASIVAQLPPGMLPELTEADWMARHPLGYVEQRQALAANGQYGSWLRKHAAVAKIGDTIFVHGGIHPRLSSMSLDAINDRVRSEISTFDAAKQSLIESGLILPFFTLDEITSVVRGQLNLAMKSGGRNEQQAKFLQLFLSMGGWLCVNSDGPLWFRGYAQWSDEEAAPALASLLQTYKAAHFVVGHSPQSNGHIRSRFDGKVLLIDTGMLQSYYPFGRASALRIENTGKFIAEYADSEEVLIPGKIAPQAQKQPGTPPEPLSQPAPVKLAQAPELI